MRTLGRTPGRFRLPATCQYRGRLFSFSRNGRKLRLIEVILGEKVRLVKVQTTIICESTYGGYIGCCPLEDGMLVTTGEEERRSAALVKVEDGKLSAETVRVATLTIIGEEKWLGVPLLCQVSRNRAILFFSGKPWMWSCEVDGDAMKVQKLTGQAPTARGFCALPVLIPGGNLLVAGANPYSTSITEILWDGDLRFEKVGDIPGEARWGASTVLVAERFLIGFGGSSQHCLRDMWIFDIQTRRSSRIRQAGEWHAADWWVFLAVRAGSLYLVGGGGSNGVSVLSLATLAGLIRNGGIRIAFQESLGLRVTVRSRYRWKGFGGGIRGGLDEGPGSLVLCL